VSNVNGVVVGREREIAEASGFLDHTAERSRGLLVVGEPGIGKTTLWEAVIEDAAARGREVVIARPSEAEGELAFAGLTDLLDRVDEDGFATLADVQRTALAGALRRGEGGTSIVDPATVGLALLDVLRRLASGSPLVVAVDDLQWLDAPTLRALTFAFRRLDEAAVGLVATVRAGFDLELTRLAERDGNALDRIHLGGLEKPHLAHLVFERTGRALTPPQLDRLMRLSAGNPYYALELATTGDPELAVPESLAGRLRARLAGLSAPARASGLTAATLGRFDSAVVGEGIDELRRAGIVVVRSGSLSFDHPLLASTLLEMHTSEERNAVHLTLAAAVDDPDERALHLGHGTQHPSEAVAIELEETAARVEARGAPESAALLVERAAALTPRHDATAITRRLLRAADLYQAAGEGREHVLPLLAHLAETLPASPDRARALMRLGWLGAQMDTMPMSESVAYQERALEEAGGAPDVVAAAHASLARLRGIGGDYRAALRHAELAVVAGARPDENLMFPSPSGELGIARFFAGEGLDRPLFEVSLELEARAGRIGEPYQTARLQLALASLYTGELGEARAALEQLLELSVELGRVRSTAGCALHLTELEVRAGNLDRAEAHAQEFLVLDRQLRGNPSAEWYPSGLVAMHLGRIDEARRILEAGVEESRALESTIWLAHHLSALGHLGLAIGELEAARDALGAVPAMLRETGLGEWSVHAVHPDAIETLVGLDELDEAAVLQRELEDYGRRLDRPWGLVTAARSAALLASARGDVDEALVAAEQALLELGRLDWPLERGRTLLVTGEILRRLGRRRDAAVRLGEARTTFELLRSPLWIARVEAEERRLGGRRTSGDTLTATESRVAELAAQGLRNAEIAARLHVTQKTIEATLSRVYRKLGVRSRTELARREAAADTGPPDGSRARGSTLRRLT
jgi:DNA-binding CsgD family transcriptional regulator